MGRLTRAIQHGSPFSAGTQHRSRGSRPEASSHLQGCAEVLGPPQAVQRVAITCQNPSLSTPSPRHAVGILTGSVTWRAGSCALLT